VDQRFRELLDNVVADVTPQVVDPVAEVMRRSRRGRRIMVAGGVAVAVVLAVGAAAAIPRFVAADERTDVTASASPTEVATPAQTVPAIPRVVGEEVVAGGLVVPVPPGWRTVDDAATVYCDVAPRTIAVGFDPVPGGTGKYCGLKPFISVAGLSVQGGWALRQHPGVSQRQLTLPGGQPAWLSVTPRDDALGQQPFTVVRLYLPWSAAVLAISLDQKDFAQIFPTIRTRPVTPSVLSLPDNVTGVQAFGPGDSASWSSKSGPRSRDPATVHDVLQRLQSLTDVVPNDEACATADMPTVVLQVGSAASSATIVITVSEHCAQATSSLGGRVAVPPGFTDQLWRLLGGDGTVEPTK
jgi:hypothetical protein